MLLCQAVVVQAHEVRPALLEIEETGPGQYDVLWKLPILQGKIPYLYPRFAENITVAGQPSVRDVPGARVEKSKFVATSGSLVGTDIFIDGLSATQIDVLVQVTLADGLYYSTILRPKEPT